MADEKSKIFVDNDWKRQAHEEKRRLADQDKPKEPAAAPKRDTRGPETGAPTRLPPASFEALVSTFMTQTLFALGMVDHPDAQRTINLELAKFNIDLLTVLSDKTKGNLTSQEQDLLDQALHQLRMAFVEVAAAHAGPIGSQ